jgi:hypothetical protein
MTEEAKQGRFVRALEAELVEHFGGRPSIAERLLIDRAVRLRVMLDMFDEKIASGNFTPHDQRTYGGLSSQFRLVLRELGVKASAAASKPATLQDYWAGSPPAEPEPRAAPAKHPRARPPRPVKPLAATPSEPEERLDTAGKIIIRRPS